MDPYSQELELALDTGGHEVVLGVADTFVLLEQWVEQVHPFPRDSYNPHSVHTQCS